MFCLQFERLSQIATRTLNVEIFNFVFKKGKKIFMLNSPASAAQVQ